MTFITDQCKTVRSRCDQCLEQRHCLTTGRSALCQCPVRPKTHMIYFHLISLVLTLFCHPKVFWNASFFSLWIRRKLFRYASIIIILFPVDRYALCILSVALTSFVSVAVRTTVVAAAAVSSTLLFIYHHHHHHHHAELVMDVAVSTSSRHALLFCGRLHAPGLPSRTLRDRTYSAQRFSFLVIFLSSNLGRAAD